MFTIEQQGDQWALLRSDGAVESTHATYPLAVGALVERLTAALAAVVVEGDMMPEVEQQGDGLLPETWRADLCFSEDTGDGRDFSQVTWSSRNPAESTMPIMLQTCSEMGHFGAELAGFFSTIALGAAPTATGRFYDTDCGRQLRDMLLDGRRFGVSVDPGAVDAEMICDVMDESGMFCEDGHFLFHDYEIIGVTATPFPAFARAGVEIDTTAAETPAAAAEGEQPTPAPAVAAAASVAVTLERPPRRYFDDPHFAMPTPLTITDDGHVMAHVAAWDTCHVGNSRLCIVPPTSRLNYERLYAYVEPRGEDRGGVECADGSRLRTGSLTWGIPHADLTLDMIHAQEHYADSRHGWADVVAGEDEFGIWVAGALRPNVTSADVRVLNALALSGDWRYDDETRALELIAALAVNVPGFPIPRVVVASGAPIAQPTTRAGIGAGLQQRALVASGIVLPSIYSGLTREPCGCDDTDDDRLERIERGLSLLERRTRHLVDTETDRLAQRFVHPTSTLAGPPASFTLRTR